VVMTSKWYFGVGVMSQQLEVLGRIGDPMVESSRLLYE
jgi:hypothetical protein